jgi:endonuclease G
MEIDENNQSITLTEMLQKRNAKQQIMNTLDIVQQARLPEREKSTFDAEPNKERRINRLKSIGLQEDVATRLATGGLAALKDFDPGLQKEAEDVLNRFEDRTFVDVSYLECARAAANSVGRVVFEESGKAWGTGVMISDQLFLTNWHVVNSTVMASEMLVQFNYERDVLGRAEKPMTFKFAPEKFYFCNEKMDFAIVAVDDNSLNSNMKPSNFGYVPICESADKHIIAEFATIIQHPEGDYKQINLRENRIIGRYGDADQPGPPVLLYPVCNTMKGSSGSPVFNDQLWIVAVHCRESATKDLFTHEELELYPELPELIGVGTRASAICTDLESRKKEIIGSEPKLIKKSLQCRFRGPSQIKR